MSSQPQNSVLILYADTGSGHRSVAFAIHSALRTLTPATPTQHDLAVTSELGIATGIPTAQTTLHNPVKHHLLGSLFDLYGPVTRRVPRLFAEAYDVSNSERVCNLAGRVTYRLLQKHLVSLIEATQPELIVSVHSLLTQPMLRVLRHGNLDIPLFSVVTDLASIHQSWIVPDVDRCFVPTAAVRDEMLNRGMRSEQLRISGLPVHPSYIARPDHTDRELLRLGLGLQPDRFTVLVMGGGEGIGGLDTIARQLVQTQLPIQLIVVAGRNPALYKSLSKQQHEWGIPHRVFGFAQNVPELMRASDVVVTKAGSVTIAESLACGLPIILSSVIEGQESGNVDFLVRHGVGGLARHAEDVVEAVQRLYHLDEESMRAVRCRARQLSTPAASFDIASQILVALNTSRRIEQSDIQYALAPVLA
jgi:UDP-N-acetylglucosamine:LPS N-acetylglucosamine transferase